MRRRERDERKRRRRRRSRRGGEGAEGEEEKVNWIFITPCFPFPLFFVSKKFQNFVYFSFIFTANKRIKKGNLILLEANTGKFDLKRTE